PIYAGDRARRRRRHHVKSLRHFDDFVAVAHPDIDQRCAIAVIEMIADVAEQFGAAVQFHLRVAELAHIGTFDLAAQLFGHGLHAITDAEHGQAHFEYALRRARRTGFGNRLWPAGEDDAKRVECADIGFAHVERINFAVHADFAHTACNQLRVLRSEIEDQDAAGVDVLVHIHSGLRSEEHTSELQSRENLVCRLLLEKKKKNPHAAGKTTSLKTPILRHTVLFTQQPVLSSG